MFDHVIPINHTFSHYFDHQETKTNVNPLTGKIASGLRAFITFWAHFLTFLIFLYFRNEKLRDEVVLCI